MVEWDYTNPMQLIFIINNYEDFYRAPLTNGVYKYVPRDILLNGAIKEQDLIFTWEKQWFADGSSREFPVVGSAKTAFGSLLSVIRILQQNAP